MAGTPEGKLKDKVKLWLKAHGAWYYMPVQTGYGVTGVPDFVGCLDGRMFGIETKAPGKRANTTPNQDRVIKQIKDSGGIAAVVDDVSQLEGIFYGL